MFAVNEESDHLEIRLSSRLDLVDRVVGQAGLYLPQLATEAGFGFKLIVRELMINAIEHGNKSNPDKLVRVEIRPLEGDRVKVIVEDQGEGFDWATIDFVMKDADETVRERGLALVNRYADALEWENGGRAALAWYSVPLGTRASFVQEGDLGRVTVQGAISASNIEELRTCLLDALQCQCADYLFDFTGVPDMDSIGLSLLLGLGKLAAMERAGKPIRVVGASDDLRALLTFARADKFYRFEAAGEAS
jgi:anti-anti-sigma factor